MNTPHHHQPPGWASPHPTRPAAPARRPVPTTTGEAAPATTGQPVNPIPTAPDTGQTVTVASVTVVAATGHYPATTGQDGGRS